MRRNCNLELQLFPVASSGDGGVTFSGRSCPEAEENRQTMTMFYDGKVCVTDETAFQARAILTLASREMEEVCLGTPTRSVCASPGGVSMKRSLRQFLQKRRDRVRSTSPYNC